MIPPPHPEPAVIDEKANYSHETTRMLEIQALALQRADKGLVSLLFLSFGIRVATFRAEVSPVHLDLRERNRSR